MTIPASPLPGTFILQLPPAIALDGSETVPIVQGGTTKRATVNQITSDAGLNFVRSDGGVSAPGNIAFFTNTTSTRIGASPLYQSGNPGNAALFSSVPNRTLGLPQTFNGFQFSQGSPILAANQGGQNITGLQQALVGTISLAAGETKAGIGVAGYAESNSADPANAIGIFGQAQCNVAGGSIFGGSLVAQNIANSAALGLDANYLAGLEINPNLWKKAGGTNPTVNGNHFYGLNIQGGGNHTNEIGSAIVINNAALPATTRWASGIEFVAGSSITAVNIGPVALGNSQSSQSIVMTGADAGGLAKSFAIFADPNGSGYFSPAVNGQLNILDGSGHVLLQTQAVGVVGGNTGVVFPQVATAGVITNSGSGVLSSSASLAATLGGTGQTACALGDTLYSSATNTLSRLAGNTTAAKQYLSQTGTGTVSAAPAWAAISGADITGAALTKTDDTNVTLALGGSPTTALLRAASLTLGWTGTLAAVRGGFGADISGSSGVPLFAAGAPTFTGTTGTGTFVRAAAPTFTAGITVTTNVASSTFNNVNIVVPGSTAALTLASAKTFTVNNTLTLNGTDGTAFTFPTTNATLARTDAAQTFAGTQTFTLAPVFTDASGTRTALGLGALATVTPGTGVATALAINIGSAGAPVLFNGALGSPSSVGTLPAHTLGGAISGGGNQINNVIIGNSTPLAGSFTTVNASTSITPTNIVGTTTNNNAAAGSVGEYVQSSIAIGSQVALTSNTPALITSISLTAGDWDVTLQPIFIGAAITLTNYIFASVSSTGALDTTTPGAFASIGYPTGGTAIYASTTGISLTLSPFRFSLSGTTTISAYAQSGFTTSTAGVYGLLRARRVR